VTETPSRRDVLHRLGVLGAGSNVTVAMNGMAAQVTYAGVQGSTSRLDQVNVLLPPQLNGSGTVNIVLTAGSSIANVVNLAVQ
jgi:uncharacterized protein (TIGR03437 family)